jgi:predicted RNA binding protein YcfA (HicA-like mRNA interferase family)
MAGPVYRRLIKLLKDAGCSFVRHGKGSHEIWMSPITNRHFVVPFDVAKRSTANSVLTQAGLPKAF